MGVSQPATVSGQNGCGQNGSGQNGTDKMVQGQNDTRTKLYWTKWCGQNGADKMVQFCILCTF